MPSWEPGITESRSKVAFMCAAMLLASSRACSATRVPSRGQEWSCRGHDLLTCVLFPADGRGEAMFAPHGAPLARHSPEASDVLHSNHALPLQPGDHRAFFAYTRCSLLL